MPQQVNHLLQESNSDLFHAGVKGGVGFGGSLAAMSINDIAGLIVAILTGIYMCFQIEAAWRKRKAAIAKEKELNNELSD
ncbi:MAG: hypothetical protein ACPGQQ_00855 [Candidatus Puniceispirillaceae bacterium]